MLRQTVFVCSLHLKINNKKLIFNNGEFLCVIGNLIYRITCVILLFFRTNESRWTAERNAEDIL